MKREACTEELMVYKFKNYEEESGVELHFSIHKDSNDVVLKRIREDDIVSEFYTEKDIILRMAQVLIESENLCN